MGEQARGLADDEFRPGPPRHHERLERILRTLSLAKADRSKAIFKSGFFLCYYDDEHGILHDLKLSITFDDTSKRLLVDLNVSYMFLAIVGDRNSCLFDSRIPPRDHQSEMRKQKGSLSDNRRARSRSPPRLGLNPKRVKVVRDCYANGMYIKAGNLVNSNGADVDVKPHTSPAGPSSNLSSSHPSGPSSLPTTTAGATADPAGSMMAALKVLQNSATMQALLKGDAQRSEVAVKQEEIEMSFDNVTIAAASARGASGVPRRDERPIRIPWGVSSDNKATSSASHSAVPSRPPAFSRTPSFSNGVIWSGPPPPTGPKAMSQSPPKPSTQLRTEELGLTRDLQDVRRQITALKAKEDTLLQELRKINPAAIPLDADKKTTDSDALAKDLAAERERRKRAEEIWEDARREYRNPLVVPAMMDAFEKLARIAGDALVSSTTSSPVNVNNAFKIPTTSPGSGLQSNSRWGPKKSA